MSKDKSLIRIPFQKLQYDILKAALVAMLTGLIGFFISNLFSITGDLKTLVVGTCIFIGVVAVYMVQKGVSSVSEDIGKKFITERTGIVEVYKNLQECEADIKADFKNAKDIRLLLQIGRREFGNGEASFFVDFAKEKKQVGDNIRILRASLDSPFMSEIRAKQRGYSVNRWRTDIKRLRNEIELLREQGVRVNDREHSEPFLWRIFLFDKVAYVSGYLHPRDNDNVAVVYKIREGSNSLYPVYDRYFEYLWKKYDPETINCSQDEVWKNWS